ncbi:MAG: nucleoside triphosphate pyrophosphatase [Actinomycetota bacterium]
MLEEEDRSKKIILASASPRRKEILKLLKLDFGVIEPKNCEEKQYKNPYHTVIDNSIIKAKNVYNYIKEQSLKKQDPYYGKGFLIAGFDTIIYMNNRYMGKPANIEQAIEFLNIFSGRIHRVVSGVCVLDSISGKYYFDTETTKVRFRKLTEEDIKAYIDREDVLDKAGAYNIFGFGSLLVERINGCFYNIAGFPVKKFADLVGKFKFNILS